MPNIESAKKRVRVSERRRLRNKSVRSEVKTKVTKAEKLIFSGETAAAQPAAAAAISALDKASEKGVLHKNNSARRKSRLMKKLNQSLTASKKKAEETE
ncbi:30S ribosomal protein S20 [Chloroflexota bacterium]